MLAWRSIFKHTTNLSIRGFTLVFKFLFALFLGKYFADDVLGQYGIFSTTILFTYYVISLNFESYGMRELIEAPIENHLSLFRNIILFFFISYLISGLLSFLINTEWLNGELVYYFFIILFLEVYVQLLFTFFVYIKKSLVANLILFISQGSWIALSLIVWKSGTCQFYSLNDFLIFWVFGSGLACVFGFVTIMTIYAWHFKPIDWGWIRKGLGYSLIFFLSTLGYKIIELGNRYFVEFILGTSQLGAFIFYSQFANLINTFISVSVILEWYPKLLKSLLDKDFKLASKIRKNMYFKVVLIWLGISLVSLLFMQGALRIVHKEQFYSEVNAYYILLFTNLFLNLSFIPHYHIFGLKKDKQLLITTLIGTFISVILNFSLIPWIGITGASIATLVGFMIVWISKEYYLRKIMK